MLNDGPAFGLHGAILHHDPRLFNIMFIMSPSTIARHLGDLDRCQINMKFPRSPTQLISGHLLMRICASSIFWPIIEDFQQYSRVRNRELALTQVPNTHKCSVNNPKFPVEWGRQVSLARSINGSQLFRNFEIKVAVAERVCQSITNIKIIDVRVLCG
jgi:hypothetical protein